MMAMVASALIPDNRRADDMTNAKSASIWLFPILLWVLACGPLRRRAAGTRQLNRHPKRSGSRRVFKCKMRRLVNALLQMRVR